MSILSPGILVGSGGGGGGGGLADAPADGKTYGRRDAAWTAVESAGYRHVQAAASAVWVIQHNLGAKPVALWTFGADGNQIFGEPDYPGSTANMLSVGFSAALSGTAYVKPAY
jgi:hypothetical protein